MKNIITLLLALQPGLVAGSAQFTTDPIVVWPLAYQGTISSYGVAVNTPHDVILSLWAGPVGGTQIGASITNETVDVNNGQFRIHIEGRDGWSTSDLSATNLYLQTALRPSGSGAPFVTLSPRQRLASVPRAAVAEKAMSISLDALAPSILGTNGVDGAILALGSVTGNQIGTSQVVKSLNGLTDNVTLEAGDGLTLTASSNTIRVAALPLALSCFDYTNCYWNLVGNGNTFGNGTFAAPNNFLGTINNWPLELRVNNQRALRLEPTASAPNLIGGFSGNVVNSGAVGGTIGGGGAANSINRVSGNHGTVSGGRTNVASALYATVGGGYWNLANGTTATVGGGETNIAGATGATVGGGLNNTASQVYSTVGGGARNVASGNTSTVGGGHVNSATSFFTTVSGGQMNMASLDYATVAGGRNNTNTAWAGSIGGGSSNIIAATALFAGIPSGLSGHAESYGQLVHANGRFDRAGDAQCSEYVLRRTLTTTNCVNPEELFLDGDAGASQRMIMPANSTWSYEIMIAGRSTLTGLSAGSKVSGLAQCNGGGIASLAGVPSITQLPGTAILIPIVGVTGNKLILRICNDLGENFRVVACVRASQVQNP